VRAANTIGLILAGGLGRRMGTGKALVNLRDKPLLQWAIERAEPQVDELLINANGDPKPYERFGLDILPDSIEGHLGPLAGIMTGLEWMKENRPESKWLATFAIDTPFFPHDLVARLIEKAETSLALVAVGESDNRRHPIFAVWSAGIEETAHSTLIQNEFRKVEDFVQSLPHRAVAFETEPFDPFFNINTLSDLSKANALAERYALE
jgi:molybdenum cofactor guanylyltransferase